MDAFNPIYEGKKPNFNLHFEFEKYSERKFTPIFKKYFNLLKTEVNNYINFLINNLKKNILEKINPNERDKKIENYLNEYLQKDTKIILSSKIHFLLFNNEKYLSEKCFHDYFISSFERSFKQLIKKYYLNIDINRKPLSPYLAIDKLLNNDQKLMKNFIKDIFKSFRQDLEYLLSIRSNLMRKEVIEYNNKNNKNNKNNNNNNRFLYGKLYNRTTKSLSSFLSINKNKFDNSLEKIKNDFINYQKELKNVIHSLPTCEDYSELIGKEIVQTIRDQILTLSISPFPDIVFHPIYFKFTRKVKPDHIKKYNISDRIKATSNGDPKSDFKFLSQFGLKIKIIEKTENSLVESLCEYADKQSFLSANQKTNLLDGFPTKFPSNNPENPTENSKEISKNKTRMESIVKKTILRKFELDHKSTYRSTSFFNSTGMEISTYSERNFFDEYFIHCFWNKYNIPVLLWTANHSRPFCFFHSNVFPTSFIHIAYVQSHPSPFFFPVLPISSSPSFPPSLPVPIGNS